MNKARCILLAAFKRAVLLDRLACSAGLVYSNRKVC